MDLDELRAVQNKERQKDSLQHLRESFYADVADYVADLERRRDAAAEEADDPFASPDVRRLTDEIETVREVAEAVYERRLGKLVKRASLAAADMPADAEGLTAEEEELFDDLVARIEGNKQRVLDVVEGEADPATAPSTGAAERTADETRVADATRPGPGAGGDGTDSTDAPAAADVMGPGADDPVAEDGHGAGGPGGDTDPPAPDDEREPPAADGRPEAAEAAAAAGGDDPGEFDDDEDGPLAGLDDRTTVRITDDVGEIFGVDDRDYDLSSDDVVTLPAANAEPLLERDAAERID